MLLTYSKQKGQGQNGKKNKIEQYQKAHLNHVSQEQNRLQQMKNQAVLIASTQKHANILLNPSIQQNKELGSLVGIGIGNSNDVAFTLHPAIINNPVIKLHFNEKHDGNTGKSQGKESSISVVEVDTSLVNDNQYELNEPETLSAFLKFLKNNQGITICNVYQEKYANGKYATGFGDYIRGCYFLIQFCEYIKTKYHITLNYSFWIIHPLSSFLSSNYIGSSICNNGNNNGNNIKEIRLSDIVFFEKQNWNGTQFCNGILHDSLNSNKHIYLFMDYLMHDGVLAISKNVLYVYTISYPLFLSCISPSSHKIIQQLLLPNVSLSSSICMTMDSLSIFSKKYKVIHIRSGDKFLSGDSFSFAEEYKTKLRHFIDMTLSNERKKGDDIGSSETFLLLSDNNAIKDYVLTYYPFMLYLKNTIGHFGEGAQQDKEKNKNNLLDFFLLSHSSKIISFTSYLHGSGFSRWCAETYGIPYLCYFL